jgi:molybdate transport system substrate-binding protein
MFKLMVRVAVALALAMPAALAQDLPEVHVFAAASTTEALNEIGALFAAAGKGRLVAAYASSSTLAKQIENGAPAEIFVSADEQWADYLARKNLLDSASRVDLLGNRLALVAPADSTVELTIEPGMKLARLLGDNRLAIGDPDHVPAGIYAKAALISLGVWNDVEAKLARADSVRAALAFVERGECPLGIAYTSDALTVPKLRVVAVFPEDSHPPIRYPAALVAGQTNPAARAFLAFLQTPVAGAVFRKYGFLTQ